MVVWLVIGLGLFCSDALRDIWRHFVAHSAGLEVPPRSTLCMARQRIGARILVELAKAVLRPLADSATEGCFYKGMALRAIDICNLSLYDSPDNRRIFSPRRTQACGAAGLSAGEVVLFVRGGDSRDASLDAQADVLA
jgi:hypothetical protein